MAYPPPSAPQEVLGDSPRRFHVAADEASRELFIANGKERGGVRARVGQFTGAVEGGFRLLGGEALAPQKRLAVGGLEIEAALSLRDVGLDLLRLRQRCEQRLCLGSPGTA
jgi:hypothetical protein